jgi:tetratricopeptide (TPR) repeat protein
MKPFGLIIAGIVFIGRMTAPTPVPAQEAVKSAVNAQTGSAVQQEADQLEFAQGLLSRGMYDMAIAQFQKFISDYPGSSSLQDAYLALGEGYFLSQDLNKAVDTFSQFKQLYPKSEKLPVSLLRLGEIDIQQKKYDEAIKELTSLDTQNLLKGQMLQSFDFYTAKAYLGKADNSSALNFFQQASQVAGAADYTADAYEEAGKIQVKGAHYPEALDAYTKAMSVAQDPGLKGDITYRIAEAQFLSGQYADAVKGFQQVLDQYPALGFRQDALANLLLAYFNLGQYDQLLGEYQKHGQEIKDDAAYFSIHLGAVLAFIESKQYDQANALLDKILTFPSLSPQQKAKVLTKKADILLRQEKYKESLGVLETIPPADAADPDEVSFLTARSHFGSGDYDKAFGFFEKVYLNFPSSRFSKAALLGQAHSRQKTNRFKEAGILFLKYYDIQDQPDLKSEALYNAVLMEVKAGDVSGAVSSAQEYLKVFPNGAQYSEVLLVLCDNYGKSNQSGEAVKLLQGYLAGTQGALKPNAANFLLGYNQQLLGHSDQALEAYSKVDPQKEEGKFYTAALKNMAIIYLNQKNFDQAKANFDRLISLPDQNDLQIKTYVWVCNQYLKDQKFDDVLRVAAQAEKKFASQDLSQVEYFRAEALRGQGKCDEAGKSYDLVTASAQKNAYTGNAHIGHGLCLSKDQKFDDARQELQKALDENADDAAITVHARFEMANLNAAQSNYPDAIKFYLLVATIYDDVYYCPESLLRAADIFEHLQRKADAVKMYSEILEKYKSSPEAKTAQEKMSALK